MATAGEPGKDPVDDTNNDDQRLEQKADHGATPPTGHVRSYDQFKARHTPT